MLTRYHITLGASTTAGGTVASASSLLCIDGAAIALEDDTVSCPACHAQGVIKPDGPRISERFNGREVALSGDLCICKCSPPPKLVQIQTRKVQHVDANHLANRIASATIPPATDAHGSAPDSPMPVRLLHPVTREPLRYQRYRLQLAGGVVEGMTDGDGCTRPLHAAERNAVQTSHADDAA
jgi:uncharacterized Zn-binding protein involved in type VI secretion